MRTEGQRPSAHQAAKPQRGPASSTLSTEPGSINRLSPPATSGGNDLIAHTFIDIDLSRHLIFSRRLFSEYISKARCSCYKRRPRLRIALEDQARRICR